MIGRRVSIAAAGIGAVAVFLGGCASGTKSSAEIRAAAAGEAERAHYELRRGELDAASRLINKTDYRVDDDLGRARAVIKAEVLRRQGAPEDALDVLAGYAKSGGGDPRYAEVRALCLMALGEFGEAQGLFAKARGLYALDDDRRRVHDLGFYAEACGAYARGDRQAATESISNIINRELKARIAAQMESLGGADVSLIATNGG